MPELGAATSANMQPLPKMDNKKQKKKVKSPNAEKNPKRKNLVGMPDVHLFFLDVNIQWHGSFR